MIRTARFRTYKHQRSGLMFLAACLPKDSIGAEIGCAYGESAHIFMQSGRVKALYCVDSWEGEYAERMPAFDKMARQWQGRILKIRKASIEAAKEMPIRSLDWVYIDAKHDFLSVCEDISTWLPKVRPGGIMAGHDFRHGVERAVRKLFGNPLRTFEDSSWMVIV